MITVTNNSDKQINAALLSIDADIKQLKTDTDSTVSSLKSSIDTTKAGLNSGTTYDISISGNAATATTAVYASTAGSTSTASTAGTASKVTNSLTITNNGTTYTYNGSSAVSVPIATSIASALTTNITNTYSNSAVGTTTYNGSADVANNIYLPNQSLNSTDSPTFNTVTATLSGNATSADKVNNAITITSTTGYTTPSTIVYDGSEAKTATIYTPDQEVNKTSSPTFNTVTAALNGNATSADKVNNVLTLNVGGTTTSYDGSTAKTVTIGSNAKLTVATTDTYTAASTTEYDGSTAKTATIYTPDQEVNKTSSTTFNTVTAALNGNATSADKVNNVLTLNVGGNATSYDGSEAKTATIYTPDQEVNKTSSPTFNTVTAALNGNATSADKVNNVLTLNVGGTTTSYDGSEAKTVTIGSNAKLTVATTHTYTAASTTEYDGSTAKTATISTPDQDVNKAASPTFNTVTAALNGNATSADKVNNVLTLNVGGTTTSYDGSEAKTATIYTPDQEVNKTSSPTFNTVTAALNGNATSADKVNNVLTLN